MNVLYLSILKVRTFKLLNGKLTDIGIFLNFGTQGQYSRAIISKSERFTKKLLKNKIIMCTLDKH
jgi:hypothetical protein